MICPNCKTEMVKGVMLDSVHGGGLTSSKFALADVSGPTMLMPFGKLTNIKTIYNTIAYNCPKCGLVQTYTEGVSKEYKEVVRFTWIFVIVILVIAIVIPMIFGILSTLNP